MKKAEIHSDRIELLDSFRAISILSVMLFHLFNRWAQGNYLPYGSKYAYFSKGYLGVDLFFIISGFVIYYTLTKTDSIINFWKKRFIRLFPPLLIASILTYIVFILWDNEILIPNSHSLKNLLISITFIPPRFFKFLGIDVEYINGSYWSLWPEVLFYIYASIFYFFFKKQFRLIMSLLSTIGYIGITILGQTDFSKTEVSSIFIIVKLIEYLPLFVFGIYFYTLYNKEALKIYELGLLIIQLLLISPFNPSGLFNSFTDFYFILGMIVLFSVFVYNSKILNFLKAPYLIKIGKYSYFLYLIHENIGVLMIHKYSNVFEPLLFISPLLVILFFIEFSAFYSKYVDEKITTYLKRVLLK
jgi:peptidoglycan/LPS O-acetylase OafA/YrhL